jgi:hypothetical protein
MVRLNVKCIREFALKYPGTNKWLKAACENAKQRNVRSSRIKVLLVEATRFVAIKWQAGRSTLFLSFSRL